MWGNGPQVRDFSSETIPLTALATMVRRARAGSTTERRSKQVGQYQVFQVTPVGLRVTGKVHRQAGVAPILVWLFADGDATRLSREAIVAKAASAVGWTRDPFDRLIVGQASLNGSKVVTRDRTIRNRFNLEVW